MRTWNKKNQRPLATAFVIALALLPARLARAEGPSASASPGAAPAPASPDAPAPTPGELCSAAYERSQVEKNAGHYVAATAAALECSQLVCSSAIVKECVRMYEALEQDTPTLVFSARKAEGGELIDVKVEMDGKPAADQITGRPFAVDPGPHEFVFVHADRGRQEVSETARVGDHARVIEVTFADPNAKPAALPGALALPPAAPPERGPRRVPLMTYVLGGVGVVALGSFAYFRATAVSDWNEYNATCSPVCNAGDVDSLHQKFVFSYISLGVGIASVAGAGLVWVLAPRRDSGAEVQASVTAHGDGAMGSLKTRF